MATERNEPVAIPVQDMEQGVNRINTAPPETETSELESPSGPGVGSETCCGGTQPTATSATGGKQTNAKKSQSWLEKSEKSQTERKRGHAAQIL